VKLEDRAVAAQGDSFAQVSAAIAETCLGRGLCAMNTYTSFQLIVRDMAKSIDRIEAKPDVKRETEYYLESITTVKSIEDLLNDDRLFRYAMKAHGLEDMNYAKAFMRKAMEEGITSDDSFANRLSDKRYRDFVETFNFAAYGEATTGLTAARQGTVDKYLRQTLEEDAGEQNEGVRLALYFERKVADVDSFYDILADPALAQVVRTALALPDSFASADIDHQAKLFAERLNIEDFSDPEALAKFLKRFTSLWEVDHPSSVTQSSLSVLFGQPTETGISTNLLLAIQQMKR
jgi:hypothetical protein